MWLRGGRRKACRFLRRSTKHRAAAPMVGSIGDHTMQASAPIARLGSFQSFWRDLRYLTKTQILFAVSMWPVSWWASLRLLQLAGA